MHSRQISITPSENFQLIKKSGFQTRLPRLVTYLLSAPRSPHFVIFRWLLCKKPHSKLRNASFSRKFLKTNLIQIQFTTVESRRKSEFRQESLSGKLKIHRKTTPRTADFQNPPTSTADNPHCTYRTAARE